MIKAVLFDFDGVVADTMTVHVQMWTSVLAEVGIEIVPSDIYRLEGAPAQVVMRTIMKEKRVTLDDAVVESVCAKKEALFRDAGRAQLYPEIPTMMAHLKQRGMLTGLVTGTTLKNIAAILGPFKDRLFDGIITCEDVVHGKPAPDPYLAGAKKLGVSPDVCCVIENAVFGIESAKAAGMKCVAVMTTMSRDELAMAGADDVVENHTKLARKLYALCK